MDDGVVGKWVGTGGHEHGVLACHRSLFTACYCKRSFGYVGEAYRHQVHLERVSHKFRFAKFIKGFQQKSSMSMLGISRNAF